MRYAPWVRYVRPEWSAVVWAPLAVAVLPGCTRRSSGVVGDAGVIAAGDPVEAAEHASAAPSSSAAFDVLQQAASAHDAACTGGDFARCVDLGIDYQEGRGLPGDL